MKFILKKQYHVGKTTLIGFTVFLTILVLGSCGLKRINSPNTGSTQTAFQRNVENTTTVPNLATADVLTREVLQPLGAIANATLEKRYVTETGAGSYNGTSWGNAWAATNLRTGINTISDASASKVYLVMIAGGTYKPTYANPGNRSDSFGMKDRVAIMGGFQTGGGWGRTGTTIFSGDIGTAGDTTDNSYQVFSHTSMPLGNAHLYGVIITNGNADGSTFPLAQGGGMFNNGSSPVLTKVVFSGNTANQGGGMYNNASSPRLTRVVFSRNTAQNGGGIYNNGGSSPVLTTVVFSRNNVTTRGGGMFNDRSSSVLTGVVFSGNTATGDGGGMYNSLSSPVMIGLVFRNNRAADGGGMWNDNGSTGSGSSGPLIVNTIFSSNTLSSAGSGPDIAVNQGGFNVGAETIRIAGSVLGIGQSSAIAGIVGFGGSDALNISNHSLANGLVTFGADATLTINGMNFPYPTITAGSAVDLGLYVRKHVNGTYYFSETGTGTSWHTGFTSAGGLDGTAEDLPTTGTIEDLTARDIAGNARSGRPDAGVHEVR